MKIPRTIPLALLISLPIFGAIFLPKHWGLLAGLSLFTKGMLAYGLMVLLSLVAMACFGEGRWEDFGFQEITGPWWRFALYAALLGAVSTLAISLGSGKGNLGALRELKPMQIPVLLLFGPAAEEFFTRGWLQGFLQPLTTRQVKLGPASVSVPVLTAALAFGAMHLKVGFTIDAWTGAAVVVFATFLGLMAGIVRERTGSLLPAIAVHLAGNAGGILGGLVILIIQRVRGLPLSHLG